MHLKKLNLLLVLFYASGAYTESLIITADRMFGAESGMISGPVRVVVNDGLIESVNPDRIPAEAEVIELGDTTLMPGLPDMHTHLTGD